MHLLEVFNQEMNDIGQFESNPKLAIGVSGGSDSMALAILADLWCKHNCGSVTALIVDHGLQSQSYSTCITVQERLNQLNIKSHILHANLPRPSSNIQHWARNYRYNLLDEWCKKNNILHILIAHHQQDQIETFFMRMMRGSREIGLSGISKINYLNYCRLLRPLLFTSKTIIKDFLLTYQNKYVIDPSNTNSSYTRTKMRALVDYINDIANIKNKNIINVIGILQQNKNIITKHIDYLLATNLEINYYGYATFFIYNLNQYDKSVIVYSFVRVLSLVSGKTIEYKKVAKYLDDIINNQNIKNIGGCIIYPWNNKIFFIREERNNQLISLQSGQTVIWDNRFRIVYNLSNTSNKNFSIKIISNNYLAYKKDNLQITGNKKIDIFVYKTLPALYDGNKILSVPHFQYSLNAGIRYQVSVFYLNSLGR